MTNSVIIVGGFPEAIELAEQCGVQVIGVIDPDPALKGLPCPVLGNDDAAAQIASQHPGIPAFIAIDDPRRRAALAERYRAAGFDFVSLIHPRAQVSRSARIGTGVMVQFGAYVSANAELGDHARVNVYANVMHDSSVGAYSTIAPGALLLGRVRVGEACYIGAHSTVLVDVEIGDRGVVGAQANVTKAVPADCVVVGNPARPRNV